MLKLKIVRTYFNIVVMAGRLDLSQRECLHHAVIFKMKVVKVASFAGLNGVVLLITILRLVVLYVTGCTGAWPHCITSESLARPARPIQNSDLYLLSIRSQTYTCPVVIVSYSIDIVDQGVEPAHNTQLVEGITS